jgi:DMSO/TMAO reductase YedYZ molybdopterin-dependent catalytic subunit
VDTPKSENAFRTETKGLISRRQFIKAAGIAGGAVAGSLLLAASCKKSVTTTTVVTTTTTVPSTTSSSTPPSTVRLPPVNGLEYLVNSDPSKVDNSRLPVTPPELLHVLNPSPLVDIAGYRLNVHGQTSAQLSLAYSDLQQFPMTEETSLLICPTVFADNETLRGFKLSSLMNAAGVKPGAIQLVFRSLDNLQQNLAISDALGEDVILALEVDGQTLSREHGYPLRLIRPGQMGVFWLKCVNDIEVI